MALFIDPLLMTNKQKIAPYLIAMVSVLSIITVLNLDPIAQNLAYHHYKGDKTIWGINNFSNVLSNLPFLLVGLWGLYSLYRSKKLVYITNYKAGYLLFFISVSVVAFGSSYYHLNPNNHTLVWDRIPISFAFMALFSIAIAEFVSLKLAKIIIIPLLILATASVFYWDYSESIGKGDLRYYALVQLLPLVIMPMLLVLYPSGFTKSTAYWWLFISYAVAKVFEIFDAEIYNSLHFISGHSLKHLMAALGIGLLVYAFNQRKIKR